MDLPAARTHVRQLTSLAPADDVLRRLDFHRFLAFLALGVGTLLSMPLSSRRIWIVRGGVYPGGSLREPTGRVSAALSSHSMLLIQWYFCLTSEA